MNRTIHSQFATRCLHDGPQVFLYDAEFVRATCHCGSHYAGNREFAPEWVEKAIATEGESMKFLHTKGPWTFRTVYGDDASNAQAISLGFTPTQALSNDGSRFVMAENGRVALVDCQTPYKRGKGHETHCEERDANARLIAGATELLDLLVESQNSIAGDWRERRDALLLKISGESKPCSN